MKRKVKTNSASGSLMRLFAFTRPYITLIVLSLLFAALGVVMTLAAPVLIGDAVDLIAGPGNVEFEKLPPVLIKLGIVIAAAAIFTALTAFFNNLITHRTASDLRVSLFCKLNRVPLSYTDSRSHGDIISRATSDIELVSEGLLHAFTQLFTGISTVICTLVFMLRATLQSNLHITLAVVLLTPLSLAVSTVIARGSYKYVSEQTRVQGEVLGFANEYAANQKAVRAFTCEDMVNGGFEEINTRLGKCGLAAQIYGALVNPVTRFVNAIIYAVVGVLGALAAVSGTMSVGALSMFLAYANQYTKPFNEISTVIAQLTSAMAAAGRVFELLDAPDETPDPPDALNVVSFEGSLSLRDVAFSYIPDRPLISGLNLEVSPGMRIAIVGPTGCGKTTLINLLMRFYEINSGSILLDGRDIRTLTRDSLRSGFGLVLQDTWLFTGTVRENIAYGRPDADDAMIEDAARRARAHRFISLMPEGYDTVITEDGGNLSQGQKQLLCIARVMLRDSPMLILDEATSNIDTLTELEVQRAFDELMRGRTSFIVAHRLSTIREADLILVMKDGKIVERGRHAELYAAGGEYRRLCEMSIMAPGVNA